MTLGAIGVGYVGVGAAIAVIAGIAGKCRTVGDVVMMVGMWPMWAPLAWTRSAMDGREHELLEALARAKSSPLASVLPDADSARVLAARLREASVRMAELDQVLARPDFDPAVVQRRATDLVARGATAAGATAQLRVRTLGQLRALRERYRSELDEVDELIAQLVTQAELMRLQPSHASASGELVRELVNRVEGLGELIAYASELSAEPVHQAEIGETGSVEPHGEFRPGGGRSS